MSPGKRMLRVDELLRREIALLCEQLVMPHIDALVTITEVSTSPDLRNATVSVSVLGNDTQRALAMQLMHEHRKQMQTEINQRVSLKYTPRLRFREDHTAEKAGRVLAILDELDLPEDEPAGQD